MKTRLSVSFEKIFAFEQWLTFVLGLVCVGFSLWAALHAQEVFSFTYRSRTADHALTALAWPLTCLVALLGAALLGFAFSKPDFSRPGRAAHAAQPGRRRG